MKVTKTIIGAVLGTVAGGTAGYFVGRELEKRSQAEADAVEFDLSTEATDTPELDTVDGDTDTVEE